MNGPDLWLDIAREWISKWKFDNYEITPFYCGPSGQFCVITFYVDKISDWNSPDHKYIDFSINFLVKKDIYDPTEFNEKLIKAIQEIENE